MSLNIDNLPSKSSFLCYHLLGVDQAASIKNWVDEDTPLVVTGTPTYNSNAARVGDANFFTTSFTTPARDRTTFIVFTDPHLNNSGATATLPVAAAVRADSASSRPVLSWNNRQQYFQPSGASNIYRASVSFETQVSSSTYNQPRDQDIYYPDGTLQRGNFRMAGLTSNSTEARMLLSHGAALQSGSAAQGGSAPSDSITTIGGHSSSTTYAMDVAAFAVASALDASTVQAVAEFIMADTESRGISVWAPKPS